MESTQTSKTNEFIAFGNNQMYQLVKPLSDAQKEAIDQSTLLIQSGELYMHYWEKALVCKDRNDPEWQNKVMFFWKADEEFPKKSLPSNFRDLEKKHFLFNAQNEELKLICGDAIPWFGMPGGGLKFCAEINKQKQTVPELHKAGFILYVEFVELTENNLHILHDVENHFFMMDKKTCTFQKGNFVFREKPVPIEIAYQLGAIRIIKIIGLY